VYQNIYAIEREQPKDIIILAGDHIYKMNYKPMLDFHRKMGADITIGALRVSRDEAKQFGVMQTDLDHRVTGFQEKPADPVGTPEDPDICLASMGIYVFNARFLYEQLCDDATVEHSDHDFGKNIIPGAIDQYNVCAFPFLDENKKGDAYWRDVGTIEAYYEASMDLIGVDPQLNLYDQHWPIRAYHPMLPPPKFVFGSEGPSTRRGVALDSIVCQGAIISGGSVARSIIGPNARVNSYTQIEDSILFDGVEVGRRCRLRRVIVDKGVRIPPETEIGFDPDADRARGFTVTDSGLVVIAREEELTDHSMDHGHAVSTHREAGHSDVRSRVPH